MIPSAITPQPDIFETTLKKDLDLIKQAEYELFRAQLSEAMDYLESRKRIAYVDFLKVQLIMLLGQKAKPDTWFSNDVLRVGGSISQLLAQLTYQDT